METAQQTALERSAPSSGAIEQIRNTQTAIQPLAILNRSELTFFADMITAADLIPYDKNVAKEVQKYRVMAKIVAGAAHKFDPISSQENLHVIQGRCVLSARGMAIKLRRTGRYDTRVEKLDLTGCKLAVLEKNEEGKWILKGHVEFNKEHADKAGLLKTNQGMYDKWGEDMYYANAIKRVCRRFAPEVLDTEPLDYRLSRESAAAQVNETQAPPQIAAPSTQQTEPDSTPAAPTGVGEEYAEQEYSEPGIAEEVVEGEFVEASGTQEYTDGDFPLGADETAADAEPVIDKDESAKADLIAAIEERMTEKIGGMPSDRKKFLKGRVLENESIDALKGMLAELDAM